MSYAQKETLINRYYSSIVNKIKMKIHKKSLINLILIIILIGSFAYADGPYGIPLDDDLKPQPMADLAIIDIIIEPTNPQINDVVTATAKITNLGNIADSYGSMILVKFPDIGMTTGVVAPPDTNNPLEPGEIEYISMDFNATEFGIYEIEASIDPLLEDINYSNNELSDTFEIVEEEVECIIPEDGMVIMENTLFCQGYYNLPNGISIGADDITLDCNGAFLEGDNKENDGIYTEKSGIEILNCKVKGFSNGVYLDFNSYNSLENLDIFENKQGIVLDSSDHNTVNNSYIHQNNFRGISSYWGDYNLLRDNIFESNGYDGIYLHSSVENILINNELTGDSIIIDGYLSQNY